MQLCTVSEFLARPHGRYVVGPTWFYFAEETLAGCVAFGRPTAAEAREVMRLSSIWVRPGAVPVASFFDIRDVEATHAAAVLPVFHAFTRENRRRLAKLVTRFAVVHPDGFLGVLVAGFFSMVRPPYPFKLFTRVEDALRWIEHPDPVGLAAKLDAIRAGVLQSTPVLSKLQVLLSERFRDLTLSKAAKHLGLSARTLQRHLSVEGTTFNSELNRARMLAAQRLMLETEESLTWIAFEVGCASPAHFSVMFRTETGESPSQWRAHHAGKR